MSHLRLLVPTSRKRVYDVSFTLTRSIYIETFWLLRILSQAQHIDRCRYPVFLYL
jgi:hypothetical protein